MVSPKRMEIFWLVSDAIRWGVFGDGLIGLEELVQLGHPLRLPAGKGQAVEVLQDVAGHLLVVLLDFGLLVLTILIFYQPRYPDRGVTPKCFTSSQSASSEIVFFKGRWAIFI